MASLTRMGSIEGSGVPSETVFIEVISHHREYNSEANEWILQTIGIDNRPHTGCSKDAHHSAG